MSSNHNFKLEFPSLNTRKRSTGPKPFNSLMKPNKLKHSLLHKRGLPTSTNEIFQTRPVTISVPSYDDPYAMLEPIELAKTPAKSPSPTCPSLVYSCDKDESLRKSTETDTITTSSGTVLSIEAKHLNDTPLISLDLRTIDCNGIVFRHDTDGKLALNISLHQKYLYFTKDSSLIDTLVVERTFIQDIKFGLSNRTMLIEFRHRRGYIYTKYLTNDSELVTFLENQKQWKTKPRPRVPNEDIMARISDIGDSLRPRTRSSAPAHSLLDWEESGKEDNPAGDKEEVRTEIEHPKEVPEKFEPDLKHNFGKNKEFRISYSDFKTLYNNDWINDTIIDFFIMYEIDKTINEQKLLKEHEIYAFNSFFFTKLMTHSEVYDEVNYYGNIKRWLNKIDFLSYPYVILPICENLHWYCCVIKGLPNLLLKGAAGKDDLDYESVPLQDPNDSLNPPSELVENPEDPQEKPKKAEIYIFDSLGLRHGNIHHPLKSFIIDYCMDRHKLEIPTNRIRVHSARVPKQNNFNDCGIHVIYNVRKYLSSPDECEKVWKSPNKFLSRSFFLSTERNGLRKELIHTLLELHKKQIEVSEESNDEQSGERPGEASEDEIEVIGYNPGKSNEPNENDGTAEEKKNTIETSEPKQDDSIARVKQTENTFEVTLSTLKNSTPEAGPKAGTASDLRNLQLRELFRDETLSKQSIEIFNGMFHQRFQRFSVDQADLIKDFNFVLLLGSNKEDRERKIKHFKRSMDVLGHTTPPRRPMDETFTIQHEPNNSDELNQSVHKLRISSNSPEENVKNQDVSRSSILKELDISNEFLPIRMKDANGVSIAEKWQRKKEKLREKYPRFFEEKPTTLSPKNHSTKTESQATFAGSEPGLDDEPQVISELGDLEWEPTVKTFKVSETARCLRKQRERVVDMTYDVGHVQEIPDEPDTPSSQTRPKSPVVVKEVATTKPPAKSPVAVKDVTTPKASPVQSLVVVKDFTSPKRSPRLANKYGKFAYLAGTQSEKVISVGDTPKQLASKSLSESVVEVDSDLDIKHNYVELVDGDEETDVYTNPKELQSPLTQKKRRIN